MKAAVIAREGVPVANNVEVVNNWVDLSPRAGEVVVKTEASALNHLDLWVGIGMPGLDLEYPRISGSDGCGIAAATLWVPSDEMGMLAMPMKILLYSRQNTLYNSCPPDDVFISDEQ